MAALSPLSLHLWLHSPRTGEGTCAEASCLLSPPGARGRRRELACRSPAHPHSTMTRTPSTPHPLGGTPSPPTILGGTLSQGDTHSQGGIQHQGGTLIRARPCPPCLCGLVSGAPWFVWRRALEKGVLRGAAQLTLVLRGVHHHR